MRLFIHQLARFLLFYQNFLLFEKNRFVYIYINCGPHWRQTADPDFFGKYRSGLFRKTQQKSSFNSIEYRTRVSLYFILNTNITWNVCIKLQGGNAFTNAITANCNRRSERSTKSIKARRNGEERRGVQPGNRWDPQLHISYLPPEFIPLSLTSSW